MVPLSGLVDAVLGGLVDAVPTDGEAVDLQKVLLGPSDSEVWPRLLAGEGGVLRGGRGWRGGRVAGQAGVGGGVSAGVGVG